MLQQGGTSDVALNGLVGFEQKRKKAIPNRMRGEVEI